MKGRGTGALQNCVSTNRSKGKLKENKKPFVCFGNKYNECYGQKVVTLTLK